ncbi:MAG: C-GCAxxG-C-C family protein [Bacilli bacterium]|nr:C-GCAxxG-C-C family protein [Bacilli bacterium]
MKKVNKINREETAKAYFRQGYSCSQAVMLAYQDLIKLDKKTILKISSPFGGGMGRLRETCGALSGAFLVLGYLEGNDSIDNKRKEVLYKKVQAIAKGFEKENGFIQCRHLLHLAENKSSPKPSKRNEKYYHSRPCVEIVGSATRILEKHLK